MDSQVRGEESVATAFAHVGHTKWTSKDPKMKSDLSTKFNKAPRFNYKLEAQKDNEKSKGPTTAE